MLVYPSLSQKIWNPIRWSHWEIFSFLSLFLLYWLWFILTLPYTYLNDDFLNNANDVPEVMSSSILFVWKRNVGKKYNLSFWKITKRIQLCHFHVHVFQVKTLTIFFNILIFLNFSQILWIVSGFFGIGLAIGSNNNKELHPILITMSGYLLYCVAQLLNLDPYL